MTREHIALIVSSAGNFTGCIMAACKPGASHEEIMAGGKRLLDPPLKKLAGIPSPTDEQVRVFLLELMELCAARILSPEAE